MRQRPFLHNLMAALRRDTPAFGGKHALAPEPGNAPDLRGANLANVDLEAASLQNANLNEADLHGANLAGADLTGSTLRGTNFENAHLECANLAQSIYDDRTLFPPALREQLKAQSAEVEKGVFRIRDGYVANEMRMTAPPS